jgi:hypothetical protein
MPKDLKKAGGTNEIYIVESRYRWADTDVRDCSHLRVGLILTYYYKFPLVPLIAVLLPCFLVGCQGRSLNYIRKAKEREEKREGK